MSKRYLSVLVLAQTVAVLPRASLAQAESDEAGEAAIRLGGAEDLYDVASQATLDPAIIEDAAVEVVGPFRHGIGYLVADRRTVVVVGATKTSRLRVRMVGSDDPWIPVARAERIEGDRHTPVVLRLDSDLPGQPLRMAEEPVEAGDRMWLADVDYFPVSVRFRPTMIAPPSSGGRFSVDPGTEIIYYGEPLFDDDGGLVGFLTVWNDEGTGLRPREFVEAETLVNSANRSISPFNFILGAQVGMELGGVYHLPAVAGVFDLGFSLWDQLGIVVRAAFGAGSDTSLQAIAATSEHNAGVVETVVRSFHIGMELRYRLLLRRDTFPLYVDFAAGVAYTRSRLRSNAPALISTDPECDPMIEECPTTSENLEIPNPGVLNMVGPVLGFDFRFWLFSIGYRLITCTAFHDRSPAHHLSIGVNAF